MIEKIGGFELEMFAVALDRGERRLDRFLSHFLGAFLDALGKELGGIGNLRRSPLAGRHRVGELGQSLEPMAGYIGHVPASYHSGLPYGNSPFRHMGLG